MNCVKPGDRDYDASRRISNARFDLRPSSICYCQSDDDVRQALRDGRPGYVRVRSGGHQHEGMCSGEGVLIVDVSKLDTIYINGDLLVVGPGARLGNVYKALWPKRRLLPGGGCGDVCVGGLVQGGGWGLYSRALGLTCDRLAGFRIVKADGQILDVTKDGPDSRLFWAVAGGGGGNFGVVTEFRFHLGRLDSAITSFTVSWADRTLTAAVINDWRKHFPGDADTRLTSFCRATTLAGGASLDQPVVIAGNFLGDQPELEDILPRLLPDTYSAKYDVSFSRVDTVTDGRQAFQHPEYQPGPPADALRELAEFADEARGDLGSTCDGIPFPHKISSCYPRDQFGDDAVQQIESFILGSRTERTARRYLSLHCFGGAIGNANDSSCFAFRQKPFLLQYQAWWANKEQTDVGERCINWVAAFREAMRPHTEFAFINFPDRDLPATSRKTLLERYYGPSLAPLIAVKGQYDPGNLFDFEMGIPPR